MDKSLFLATFVFLLLGACGKTEPKATMAVAESKIVSVALSDEFPPQYASLPRINGGACGFGQPKTEGQLRYLSGWSVIAANEGVIAEAVVLSVTSKGHERFTSVAKQKREDVVKYFNSAGLLESGFSVYVDLKDAPDGAELSIYQVFQGKTIKCNNVKII